MAKNSKLKDKARYLRQNMTDAEKVLWQELRHHKIGQHFRRQMPFVFGEYKYIVDFCSPMCKLIVEVDGGIHYDPEISQLDNFRNELFSEAGYKVLRFKNSEVLYQTKRVLEDIIKVIEKLMN
jgi:very-short-patch-repair endonuclease